VFEYLCRHHDALRTRFKLGAEIVQEISEEEGSVGLQEVDLREQPEPAQAMRQHADTVQASIDLSAGSLFNAMLYRLPEQDYLLLYCHHLVIDGVSWRILLEDFSTAYRQTLDGQSITLPLKTDSFKAHAERLQQYAQSAELSQQLLYWQTLAASAEPKPQPCTATMADVGEYSISLNETDTNLLLADIHRVFNTRIDDILMAALAMTLYQWQGCRQTLIEMEGHGRDELDGLDTQRTIGWFTTAYPKALHYDPQQNLADLIKETKESLRKTPNKGLGYGVLRYLQHRPELALTPEIGFNYLGQMDEGDRNELFSVDWQGLGRAVSPKMPLAHELDILSLVDKKSLQFHFAYNRLRFADESIRQLADSYLQNLTALIAFCMTQDGSELTPSDLTYQDISIDELDLLFSE